MKPALLFQGVIRPTTPTGSITTSAAPMRRSNANDSSVEAAARKASAA